MDLQFDHKGFGRSLAFLGLIGIIAFSGNFLSKQIPIFLHPEQFYSEDDFYEMAAEPYAELPQEKPFFLSPAEVLKKKETLSWDKKDFLFIDLEQMLLRVFRNGGERRVFAILSKGRTGSFFETASGLYTVQSKNRAHVSRIENVRFPWSVYLFGNYLIHGWPEKTNGSAVSRDFSGGGIRLGQTEAQELFNLAEKEMPVLIYNAPISEPPEFSYFRQSNLPHKVPEVSAAGALAADLETGQILFEKNKEYNFPIASVTKLLTGLIAKENLPAEKIITVPREAVRIGGTMAGLIYGENFKAGDLLSPLILPSGNDVAVTYSLQIQKFIDLMNQKAKGLGMTKTILQDPTGLSENNVSSAADIFKLLKYIYEKQPDFLEITRAGEYRLTPLNRKTVHHWNNINWPKGDQKFLGGKAGWTNDALETMAGVYGVKLSEYGWRPIAIITLGSKTRVRDIRSVINYLEQGFIYGTTLAREKEIPSALIPTQAGLFELFQAYFPKSRAF